MKRNTLKSNFRKDQIISINLIDDTEELITLDDLRLSGGKSKVNNKNKSKNNENIILTPTSFQSNEESSDDEGVLSRSGKSNSFKTKRHLKRKTSLARFKKFNEISEIRLDKKKARKKTISVYTISDDTDSEKASGDSTYKSRKNGKSDKSSIESDSVSDISAFTNNNNQELNVEMIVQNENEHENEGEKDCSLGNIKYDKVKRIISAKITDPKNKIIQCMVEFEQRSDGFTPQPKRISSKLLKQHASQALVDFLMSRICVNYSKEKP